MTPAEQKAFDAMRDALDLIVKKSNGAIIDLPEADAERASAALTAANTVSQPKFVGCAYYESNGACCESEEPCKADVQNEAVEQPQAPYANCRFRICDLPGQCKGEGKCHHPAVPQAQADPSRIIECAKRLVEHADFQLGGILSSDSKAKDMPSKAVSQVKSRHLAALRDALSALPAAEPAQAAFARLDKCEGKPDGTCDKCGGSCMWFGKPAAPEAA